MTTRLLPAVLVLAFMTSACPAGVQLVRSGQATAMIVSPHRIEAPPEGAAALGDILIKSGKSGNLLHQEFSGEPGLPINALDWTASEGQYVFSPGQMITVLPGSKNQFGAIAGRDLPAPHRVTEADPLTLEFVVESPPGRKEEAYTYVRLHTAEGKGWTHGITITKEGKCIFSLKAEPNGPDRPTVPAEAGHVLDLQMVLGAKKVTWSWRNHGADEPWRPITHWGVTEAPTISGVHLVSRNHVDNGDRNRETARQVAMTQQLKKLLEQVTGATFDAATENGVPDGMARILVGDTPTVRALCPDVDFDRLGADEILIRTVGNDLVLAGGQPRGTIYAMTTFLQDHVGVRFWAPGAIDAPRDPDLAVTDLDVRFRPRLDLRHFTGGIASSFEAQAWHRISYDLQFDPSTHSMYKQLPRTLFLEHPEWFMYCPDDGDPNYKYSFQNMLKSFQRKIETEAHRTDQAVQLRQWIEIAKKTRRLPNQPCLHSAGARKTITAAAMAELAQEYHTWKHDPKVLWVTQDDGHLFCRCLDCAAVRQREGSDSANWLLLVNDIAEKVEKKYPDVLVGMFAYLHTEAPPKTLRPRDNVLIYSALLRSNKRDPVKHYKKHAEWLRRWGAISNHHWVWDYDTNFRNYFQPHPNYYVHPLNMRFFREVGVTGALVQAAQGKAADLAALRAWVTAQMMWNPDLDPRQLMVEFTNGYYGAAGRWIMLYVDLMLASVNRRDDFWLGCYRNDTTGWLELGDVQTALDLLEQAARAVEGNEELSQRVWMASRHIELAWLDSYDEFVKTAQEKNIPLGLPDPVKAVDELAPYRNAWDSFREGPRPADFYVYFDRLRERFPASTLESP